MDLTAPQHALLKRIARSGTSGYSHAGIPIGDLFKLCELGLIELKASHAFITQKGAALVAKVAA